MRLRLIHAIIYPRSATESEIFKTTINVKLSSGRTVSITFEGSKPLKTDSTGALLTGESTARNLAAPAEAITTSPPHTTKHANVSEGITCALSVNPSLDLVNEQRNDPYLSHLIDMKQRRVTKPPPTNVRDPILKTWYSRYNRLFLHNGLLVRSIGNRSPYPNYVIVVPKALRETILHAVHDNPFAGHLGISRTEERVRKRFYWPGISFDVEKHIKQCATCAHHTSPVNLNRAQLGNIEVGEPLTFWAMDFMGPLPETSKGNKHILVVVDHFTKWCEAFATPDQKASTVAPLLISKIVCDLGHLRCCIQTKGATLRAF